MKEYDPHQQQAPPSFDDDERIAALLDGRLDEHERSELIARLAGSDPEYRVFADAAAVLRDLEARGIIAAPPAVADELPEADEADEAAHFVEPVPAPEQSPTKVIELRRRWWGMPAPAWGALAAGIIALALIPVLRVRSNAFDPERVALQLQSAKRPAGWTPDTVFRATRGGESDYKDEARSFRLGVYLVDLDVAVRSRDTIVATLATRISAFLTNQVTGGGSIATTYDSIARLGNTPAAQVDTLRKEGWNYVGDLTDPSYFAAGAWLEAARLASMAHDVNFFRSREGHAGLRHLEGMSTLSDESRASVRRIREALPADGTPQWPILDDQVGDLIYALGG